MLHSVLNPSPQLPLGTTTDMIVVPRLGRTSYIFRGIRLRTHSSVQNFGCVNITAILTFLFLLFVSLFSNEIN